MKLRSKVWLAFVVLVAAGQSHLRAAETPATAPDQPWLARFIQDQRNEGRLVFKLAAADSEGRVPSFPKFVGEVSNIPGTAIISGIPGQSFTINEHRIDGEMNTTDIINVTSTESRISRLETQVKTEKSVTTSVTTTRVLGSV